MARSHENYKITIEEQQALEALLRSPQTPQGLATKAKIILLTATGETAAEVTVDLKVTKLTVYRWRKRFKDHSLPGLQDRPRSGQPRKLSEEKVKDVLRMTV